MTTDPAPELAPPPDTDVGATAGPCLQCGTPLVGAYCHGCGQHASVAEQLTLRSLWTEFRIRRLNLDRGFLRTVVDVAVRPGHVARTFVEGRRQTYTHPITLLFVVYAFYAVVFGLFEDGYLRMLEAQLASQMPATAEGADPAMEQTLGALSAAVRFLFTYGAYFTVFIIGPFAALLRWLLADRGRTFAECAVFGAYLESAVVLVSAVVVMPLSVGLQSTTLGAAGLLFYFVYAVWGAVHFFDRRPSTLALSGLSMAGAQIVYFGILGVVAFGYGIYVGMTT